MMAFTPKEVVALARLGSYDTLDYWATNGLLKPSLSGASRTGGQRRYSFTDVVAARVAVMLRLQGVGLKPLRRIVTRIHGLRDSTAHPLDDAWLVTNGRDVLVTFEREDLGDLLRHPGRGGMWLLVELRPAVREVREAIGKGRSEKTADAPAVRRPALSSRRPSSVCLFRPEGAGRSAG